MIKLVPDFLMFQNHLYEILQKMFDLYERSSADFIAHPVIWIQNYWSMDHNSNNIIL